MFGVFYETRFNCVFVIRARIFLRFYFGNFLSENFDF